MKLITSRHNPEIKRVVELHDAKARKEQQLFIAEGVRTCAALIQSGVLPTTFFVTERILDEAYSLISACDTVYQVPEDVMEKISTAATPSGMLAVFPIPSAPKLDSLERGIVLAQISDPGNMGTMIRTAAALNIKSVVVIEGADVWSPKTVQATAGTIGSVDIYQTTWEQLVAHKKDLPLCALIVSGGKKPQELTNRNCLLVVGSEAYGLPLEWIAQCDEKVTIPMPGKTESLNAAIAGSIAMYELFISSN